MLKSWGIDNEEYARGDKSLAIFFFLLNVILGFALTNYARTSNFYNFQHGINQYLANSFNRQVTCFSIFTLLEIAYLIMGYVYMKKDGKNLILVSGLLSITLISILSLIFMFFIDISSIAAFLDRIGVFNNRISYFISYFRTFGILYIPLLIFSIGGIYYKVLIKRSHLNVDSGKTRNTFGSAEWATEFHLKKMGAYDEKGAVFGKDDNNRLLRYKLGNRTIISQPGGGKSAGIIIPALLTEDRPVFVHDVKGELWATTARYRAEKFGRKIIAIDPFGVLQQPEYSDDKPAGLLQEYTINPLDFIPTDDRYRDRAITSLVRSMVVRERNATSSHWEENAKILLNGLLEYIIQTKTEKNLLTLHDLLTLNNDQMFELMNLLVERHDLPRAQAAASQILKAAAEERGSIYTTAYRQVQWLAESNMRRTFVTSNFDLIDFVKGNADIYIVMPEDQVSEQSRVTRMVFSLITSALVQLRPSLLPKKKFLFIFDELGQLEYCDDVEKGIEVLRARKVVIWAVFQTLTQIKQYQKPDLFKGAKLKQFFEIDDPETMKWLQELGGDSTVLTEHKSANSGSSSQHDKVFGGSSSKGEGTSVQESKTELIHKNDIRELADDKQFVFIRGEKAIKCKKIRYFDDSYFAGRYDKNPLESHDAE